MRSHCHCHRICYCYFSSRVRWCECEFYDHLESRCADDVTTAAATKMNISTRLWADECLVCVCVYVRQKKQVKSIAGCRNQSLYLAQASIYVCIHSKHCLVLASKFELNFTSFFHRLLFPILSHSLYKSFFSYVRSRSNEDKMIEWCCEIPSMQPLAIDLFIANEKKGHPVCENVCYLQSEFLRLCR